jgi:hypothetical protein
LNLLIFFIPIKIRKIFQKKKEKEHKKNMIKQKEEKIKKRVSFKIEIEE